MKQFEYHILTMDAHGFTGGKVDTDALSVDINRLGAAGWELASSVDTNHTNGGTRTVILIFKREKP